MTRARCIDCIFHHIHSTCSAITSTPPGFTPEFALQLLRLPCNPPSHGRAYHSSPPPLESRLCIHQAWPQLQNTTSSQGFPRVFNSVGPQSTTHPMHQTCQECVSFGSLPAVLSEASDFAADTTYESHEPTLEGGAGSNVVSAHV